LTFEGTEVFLKNKFNLMIVKMASQW